MSLISEGEDKVTKSKTQLILKHPFFAVVATKLIFRNAGEAGMGFITTMATDGRYVWWNEHFVDTLTVPKCTGVVGHETLHVALMHMLRRGTRDPLIWNIAADLAINPIVLDAGMQLPEDRLFDIKYKNWMVEAIYDDIIKNRPDIPPQWQMSMPGQGQPQQGQRGNESPSQGQSQPDQQGTPGQGQGKGQPKDLWGGFVEPKNEDGTALTESEKTEFAEDIKITVLQAAEAAKSIGKLPHALKGLVKAVGKPTVNWQDYIQSWVSGKTPDNYTWKRPNRKMLGLYNLITPSIELNGAGVGVLSIDESGSVSDNELRMNAREIMGVIEICKPAKLYIIHHDAKVHRMDVWEEGDDYEGLEIACRGGTRITPVFDWVRKEIDEEINWMICFTDMGINDFPAAKDAPDFPVLWAATGPDIAPFGTYLPIKHALEMPS